MKYTLNILLSAAFAVMLLFTASCSKKVAPDVPTARSSALFEIFRLMDSRQYRAALPLVEKYQSMEPTNEFLSELKQIVCTNIAIQEAEAFAQKGKLKEACEHLDKCIRDYGKLPGIVEAKKIYFELQEMGKRVQTLKEPSGSAVMKKNADWLAAYARKHRNVQLQKFAAKKIRENVRFTMQAEEVLVTGAKFDLLLFLRMRVEETASPACSAYPTTSTSIPNWPSIAGLPRPPAPNVQFSPQRTLARRGYSRTRNCANASGGMAANAPVNSGARTSRPSAASSDRRSSADISSGGTRSGASTDSGWLLNVSTESAPSSIRRCPRWTPSKLPSATTRGSPLYSQQSLSVLIISNIQHKYQSPR